jgi:transport factor 2 (NTF2)-like protein
MLTFEAQPFQGVATIVEKLSVCDNLVDNRKNCLFRKADISVPSQTLPFQKVQHRVDTTDAQPSDENGGIMVMVTGALMVSCMDLPILYSNESESV